MTESAHLRVISRRAAASSCAMPAGAQQATSLAARAQDHRGRSQLRRAESTSWCTWNGRGEAATSRVPVTATFWFVYGMRNSRRHFMPKERAGQALEAVLLPDGRSARDDRRSDSAP